MHEAEIDLLDPEIQACPFGAYKILREKAPVYRMPATGYYIVTRYEDIAEIIRRPDIFSMQGDTQNPLFKHSSARNIYAKNGWHRGTPLSNDPPLHTLYRKIVDVGFTAGRVRKLEPRITQLIKHLASQITPESDVEFIHSFCIPLPLSVITDRLGLPQADMPQLKIWSDAWVQPFSLALNEAQEIKYATLGVELQHYLKNHLEDRRRNPGEDILTDIATAQYNNERPLTMTEMLGLAEQILVGGNETTTNALAMGMKLLTETPGLEAQLRGNEPGIKTFVEEVLRLESPTQGLYRIAIADTQIAGSPIPKGAIVHIRFAAANRDEQQFPNPDMLDIQRRNAGAHMAFSQAHHHCLGAPLARQEMQLAFKILLENYENFQFTEGKNRFEYIPSFALRALSELWIRYKLHARTPA